MMFAWHDSTKAQLSHTVQGVAQDTLKLLT